MTLLPDGPLIPLEGGGAEPLAEVTSAVVTGAGVTVVDRKIPTIRRYDREGRMVGTVGAAGEGPGEYEGPLAVAVADGRTVVADFGKPSLLLFDTAGTFLGTRPVPDLFPFSLVSIPGGRLVVGTRASANAAFHRYDPRTGAVEATLPYAWPDWVADGVYLQSVARDYAVRFGDWIIMANSVAYPLHAVALADSRDHRSFGGPPPSHVPPPELSPADVSGGNVRQKLSEWLAEFTVIESLHSIGDSLLLVVHGHYPQTSTERLEDLFRIRPHSVDVYDRFLDRIAVDVPLNHRIVSTDPAGRLLALMEPARVGGEFQLQPLRLVIER